MVSTKRVAFLAIVLCLSSQVIAQPRLVLQVTIDGLRGDLVHRYAANLGEGGFNYLLTHGAVYTNAHYLHANTETIVGHTTLATGATPAVHGMAEMPEYAKELGYDAGRIYSDEVLSHARQLSTDLFEDQELIKDFFRPARVTFMFTSSHTGSYSTGEPSVLCMVLPGHTILM